MHEVEAIYEHGVLRPLEPLPLMERQHVLLTISPAGVSSSTNVSTGNEDMTAAERALLVSATLSAVPTMEEVRMALASIPGSLSREVIAERGGY